MTTPHSLPCELTGNTPRVTTSSHLYSKYSQPTHMDIGQWMKPGSFWDTKKKTAAVPESKLAEASYSSPSPKRKAWEPLSPMATYLVKQKVDAVAKMVYKQNKQRRTEVQAAKKRIDGCIQKIVADLHILQEKFNVIERALEKERLQHRQSRNEMEQRLARLEDIVCFKKQINKIL